MNSALRPGRRPVSALHLLLALWLACFATLALAQEDPPGRVGRIADMNGSVSWWDDEAGQWTAAERNLPLTGGDRIATAADGRAELRIGSTVLRLSNSTEVEVLRLDDERIVVQLHSGSLAARVRSREVADELELVTPEARLLPQRAGSYRLDRIDDITYAAAWRGELRVDGAPGLLVATGQRFELSREGRRDAPGALRIVSSALPGDGFNAWVTAEDQREERTASTRYVSPEMTGAEDLDQHGRWEQHPDFGAVWLPLAVQADWAPYSQGRWAWVRPWGWTWVDNAPWGFAPFHYGRWVSWRNRWCWVPGAYVARPVYAPALVAWVGGGGFGVSVQIGGPTVGWVPLAPREPYRPYYRVSPRYVERVNPAPPWRWQHPPGQEPRGPWTYGNQRVPGAVTVVPGEVLQRRVPVPRSDWREGREARDGRDGRDLRDGREPRDGRGPDRDRRGGPPQPVLTLPAPPAPPVRVAPAPLLPTLPRGERERGNDDGRGGVARPPFSAGDAGRPQAEPRPRWRRDEGEGNGDANGYGRPRDPRGPGVQPPSTPPAQAQPPMQQMPPQAPPPVRSRPEPQSQAQPQPQPDAVPPPQAGPRRPGPAFTPAQPPAPAAAPPPPPAAQPPAAPRPAPEARERERERERPPRENRGDDERKRRPDRPGNNESQR